MPNESGSPLPRPESRNEPSSAPDPAASPLHEVAAPARQDTKRPADPDKPGKREKKRQKHEDKLLRDAHRALDSWERYRALTDTLEEAHDLVDLADHKARFALVIMGGLNIVLFVIGTRPEVVDTIPDMLRPWIAGYLLIYALVALYFFMQAIESLRPRKATPRVPYPGAVGLEDHPVGLRFYEDALGRDLEAYRRAWREVRIGQLNAELAVQAHTLAGINQAKYRALQRLYVGLQLMTLMAAGLIMVAAYTVFTTRPELPISSFSTGPAPELAPAAETGPLGQPVRITGIGAREPSGIAFHPGLERLFVVGDEGRIVELDRSGRVVHSRKFKGNLEDVAVHTPSGDLVLLSERKSELVLYDPVSRRERRRWRLDTAAILGRAPASRNQGFEGLAFREDATLPGGGLFYLVHQRAPALLVAVSVDPGGSGETLGGDAVRGRWALKGFKDLTAVTYVPSLDRLLVISDGKDRLAVVRTDGTLDGEVPLPGLQQEGLCFDDQGALWVADDRGGLLKFPRGLAALAAQVRDAGGSTSAVSGSIG